MQSLFAYQNKHPNFAKKILLRKIIDIHDCLDMLRAIEATNENNLPILEQNKINIIVDLDRKESYNYFLNQIKSLGMTKTRFTYILASFVSNSLSVDFKLYFFVLKFWEIFFVVAKKGIYELDVNDFRHGGANIIGFSLVDYHNINSIKLLADIFHAGEPLNKIPPISVNILI